MFASRGEAVANSAQRDAASEPRLVKGTQIVPTAFISHSSADDRYVTELEQLVRGLGYDDVFNDGHTIAPDAEFWARIEEGIRRCDAFVVVLSRDSVGSQWVEREVQLARDENKKIIPVRIDDTAGSPWERGQRLAGLVRKYRTLLVLDGIEPLQYPVNDASGQAGMLKDQGLEALLLGLATDNPGLCVVTTRETLTNLRTYRASTAPELKLDALLREAAIALLRHLQIVGTEEELEAAWQDAGGHALTLQLLGRFIVDAFADRDIRHRSEVKFEAADLERQGRSAFKVMLAYERWLSGESPFAPRKWRWLWRFLSRFFRGAKGDVTERQRELAILRLTGLFDRPITATARLRPPLRRTGRRPVRRRELVTTTDHGRPTDSSTVGRVRRGGRRRGSSARRGSESVPGRGTGLATRMFGWA
jgi:hypothetical protein